MKYNKIALVLLPVFWPNMPPLGLACLKGYLSKRDIDVKCMDYNNRFFNASSDELRAEWKKSCNSFLESRILDIMKKELTFEYDAMINKLVDYPVIGFTVYKSNQHVVRGIARDIKAQNRSIKIILGGPQISSGWIQDKNEIEERFKDLCDLYVIGEGERPILSFMNGEDESPRIYEECDPGDLAVPDHSDFAELSYPRGGCVSVIASRGCVKRCTFCSERLMYKGFRGYETDNVMEQISMYKRKGVRNFIFHDSLINGDLDRLNCLCDAIIDKFGSVNWEAQIAVRCDMPEGIFEKIKKSGCYHLFVGLESGSGSVLKRMGKGFDPEDAVKFFEKLNTHGLSFGVSIITGFPEESEEEFRESLDFVIRNRSIIPKIEQINPFVFYEGIDLPAEYDYKLRAGALKRTDRYINAIKQEGFKYTKAFMKNLVEPEWK